MSTTNPSTDGSRVVTSLSEVKRRRRLNNLLYTRKRLTQLAAEYRSHGLDDHIELYQLQLEVEQVIADEFPAEFEARVGTWAKEETAAEHHPAVTADGCSLCKAIADRDGGGDHTAPEAA